MYAHIKGIASPVLSDRVIIEAAGVGYELYCSANTLRRLVDGQEAKLLTHFHITQDSVALFGFLTDEERTMFRKLISVSRIGPKVALNVLSVLSPEDVALAVLTDNAAAFARVQGMGRKTAERVILELKGKVDAAEEAVAMPASKDKSSSASMRAEAIAALVSLGYDGAVAGRTVANIADCDRVEDMITLALKELARSR